MPGPRPLRRLRVSRLPLTVGIAALAVLAGGLTTVATGQPVDVRPLAAAAGAVGGGEARESPTLLAGEDADAVGLGTVVSLRATPLGVTSPAAAQAAAAAVTARRTAAPGGQAQRLTARPGFTETFPTSQFHGGLNRTVTLHVPAGLLAPAPLVLALHAHAQDTDAVRTYTRLEKLADKEGFVVAFPSGASGSWNGGTCCFPGSDENVDDVAYLDEVLTLVQQRVLVDPNRISITGGSNGAMMALRYACARPLVVSAVAVVAGVYVAPCTPKRATPVLELHGARDNVIPLLGGYNKPLKVTFPPVSASLEPFRKAGSDVKIVIVPGAGHTWMTRDAHGVDATEQVWDWLRDHPLLSA